MSSMSVPHKKHRKAARGFELCCPYCGETDVAMTLDLSDLSSLTCRECEDVFAVHTAIKTLTEQLAAYQALADWIAMAGDVLSDVGTDGDEPEIF